MKRRHSRLNQAGVAHFITTTIVEWIPVFTINSIAQKTLQIFEKYRDEAQVDCLGFVLMPHHFHVILWQPDEQNVSRLMMNFKKASSVHVRKILEQDDSHADWMARFREHGNRIRPDRPRIQVWMDRYDDVAVQSVEAVRTKLNYLHGNPVRDNLVPYMEDYPYGSARDYSDSPNPWIAINTDFIVPTA